MTVRKQLLCCLILFCLLTFAIFALDALCQAQVGDGVKPLVRGIVLLRHERNTGAAFGALSGHKTLAGLLSGALLIALTAFIVFGRMRLPARLALSAALTGGACNFYMRLVYGEVNDWIELEFMRFPLFNFADICVCAGAVLFAYIFTRDRQNDAA